MRGIVGFDFKNYDEGTVYCGDNMEVLKTFDDNSIDSIVTDPPYGLGKEPDIVQVMKSWIDHGYHEIKGGGFMGKKWDAFVPQPILWKEVYRVMKPGAYALVACGTRTQDWMTASLRFAGFSVKNVVVWLYGTGFSKSTNVGKQIDKLTGSNREVIGTTEINGMANLSKARVQQGFRKNLTIANAMDEIEITRGTSDYEGYGTGLKPAVEFFTLVQKPISESSIAKNILKWGTGALNVEGCRVPTDEAWERSNENRGKTFHGQDYKDNGNTNSSPLGRVPANLIHDGSKIILKQFPESKSSNTPRINNQAKSSAREGAIFGKYNNCVTHGYGDEGSAARFFYCAKPSQSEKNEGLYGFELKNPFDREVSNNFEKMGSKSTSRANHHPTCKPVELMKYLIRLITPPNGVVLDCFAGSGTTGVAAVKERKRFILIEQEADYYNIADARVRYAINTLEPTLFPEVI